ncbi:MAG: hypothetical protein IKS41_06590 [Alphaproteobacteria bacterium]|nr:hypothetical protein [Alphaproteobacteria bacterium]
MFGELLADLVIGVPYSIFSSAGRGGGIGGPEAMVASLALLVGIGAPITCWCVSSSHEKDHLEYINSVKSEIRANGKVEGVTRKPLSHWFCGCCRKEDKQAQVFETPTLSPDITKVVIKPMCYHRGPTRFDTEIQQMVILGKDGTTVTFFPLANREWTLTSAQGQAVLKMPPQDLSERTGLRVGSQELPKRTIEEKTGIEVQSRELPKRTIYEKTGIKVSQGRRPHPVFKQYMRQYA